MGRRAERVFRINDEYQAFEELTILGHLDDDAQRDAAVSESPLDAHDARESARDVARMQRHVADLRAARETLERKRDRIMQKLTVSAAE